MERERGETAAQVANKGMPTSNRVSGGSLFEATHEAQPLFEMSMVALDASIEVL